MEAIETEEIQAIFLQIFPVYLKDPIKLRQRAMGLPGASEVDWQTVIVFVPVTTLVYCVTLVFYRLFLSPLASFPGPKLGAATLWYEYYYDIVQEGQWTFKIQDLHKQYGMFTESHETFESSSDSALPLSP